MPDRQNWTAAMVLEWVLSRDMQAVLAIAADHGAVEVDTVAKKVTEIRPASMRDVERTHAIDESISDQGETIARAIVWGDLKGIPARREIYDALKTLSSSAVLARSMSSRIISGEASRAS